ncbi:Cof-type HAD-IIB family hydrolase [Paenibacillus alginolyticus]|uniref:Cof-type HAD-IIB family hydrolase n=1 Tax=Paenibacillus alginolyticus TaxID=59839 RepID=A0ABT4GFJ1_9BACL|nr:Cof-type HAD-IIB family hydrolase [Paenibacillus alginolyticus]MCY9669448.1 Cof-type HAD-IIB family hydrolase [Paenibacillus alginolyticus]MCY9694962.1 Cof-type HAD-IIB family hydrolase [Paenibacillus alginolyticus]MEC0148956.1 Cof-type HAD-IIB family hydrolase [Paenibacillus alginolyticus]
MIKLIVSDLDGTLLDHSKKVSSRELAALKKVKEAGMMLCLASGRMNIEMQMVLEEIGHRAYSVSQNGAFIHLEDGTFMKSQHFQPKLAYQLYQLLKGFDLVKLVCSGEANYITHLTPASDEVQSRTFQPFIIKEDMEQSLEGDFAVCKFSMFGEIETLLKLKALLEEKLGDQLELFISDKDCLDIMPRSVSKGSSLLVLMEKLGLKPEEVACFGDSFNDVSMFGITPHSFAMKGAHPEVKQKAIYHVDSVAEAIGHVFAYNEKFALEQKGSTAL